MEVFVNSYTEGVSFILECLQVLIFFSAFVSCARVRVRVFAGVCVCSCAFPGRTAVYSCINRSWSLVQSLEF